MSTDSPGTSVRKRSTLRCTAILAYYEWHLHESTDCMNYSLWSNKVICIALVYTAEKRGIYFLPLSLLQQRSA